LFDTSSSKNQQQKEPLPHATRLQVSTATEPGSKFSTDLLRLSRRAWALDHSTFFALPYLTTMAQPLFEQAAPIHPCRFGFPTCAKREPEARQDREMVHGASKGPVSRRSLATVHGRTCMRPAVLRPSLLNLLSTTALGRALFCAQPVEHGVEAVESADSAESPESSAEPC